MEEVFRNKSLGIIGADIAARMGQEYASAVEEAIKQLEEYWNY